MRTWFNLICLDPATILGEKIIYFHDLVLIILILILTLLLYLILFISIKFYLNREIIHGHLIEIIWTIIPIFLLLFLAFPSLRNLYYRDEIVDPVITIKAVGHQWYWSYEYSDLKILDFDSYILDEETINLNNFFRLLDVDNRIVVPYDIDLRLLVISEDVIHSWAVPRLGIKVDAVPGRINQLTIRLNRLGLFYGQCSEICGVNHRFIPIVVECTSWKNFINWYNKK